VLSVKIVVCSFWKTIRHN